MNEHDNKKNLMYETIPAVIQLNKVPGFDPLKFLRPIISEKTKEKLLKLDLRYQKLWFRLAHPHGRMKVTALRITDQMAIFEAKVFLSRSDSEPASNFIASLTREDTLNYIKEAQETALSTALQDAGFGLQFADVTVGTDGECYGSVIPAVGLQQQEKVSEKMVKESHVLPAYTITPIFSVEKPATQSEEENLPVNERKEVTEESLPAKTSVSESITIENQATVSVEQEEEIESLPASSSETKEESVEQLPVTPVSEKEPVEGNSMESKTIPLASLTAITTAAQTHNSVSMVKETSKPAEDTSAMTLVQSEESIVAPRYTGDMSVEDIAALMTYEEARNVEVDMGICNGWTIGRVADERTPSLKYYLYGYKGNNNILRAAAKIMLDSLTEQKAG